MVKYVGTSVRQYVTRFHVSTFLHTELAMWLGYPSSHGSTSFIESTTSQMSSLSNRNADNTRSVTVLQDMPPHSYIIVFSGSHNTNL